YGDVLVFQALCEGLDAGQLRATGCAPGRPEIDEEHLACILFERRQTPIQPENRKVEIDASITRIRHDRRRQRKLTLTEDGSRQNSGNHKAGTQKEGRPSSFATQQALTANNW